MIYFILFRQIYEYFNINFVVINGYLKIFIFLGIIVLSGACLNGFAFIVIIIDIGNNNEYTAALKK